MSRKESKANFPAGIIVRKSDFSDADLEVAFNGQDAVISAVGAAAFGGQKNIVNAAVRSGAQRFIPSEVSSNGQNETALKLTPFFGQKKALLKYLKTKQSDGISWTAIATSGLLDWLKGTSVLQHPQETSNRYLYIASLETAQNEILAVLEEATGTEWSVKATTTEEQVAQLIGFIVCLQYLNAQGPKT